MPASGHGNRQGEHGSQQHIQQRKPAGASKRCEHYPRRRLRYQAHSAVDCGYRGPWLLGIPDSFSPTFGLHARVGQRTCGACGADAKHGRYTSGQRSITISHCPARAPTHAPRTRTTAGRRRMPDGIGRVQRRILIAKVHSNATSSCPADHRNRLPLGNRE